MLLHFNVTSAEFCRPLELKDTYQWQYGKETKNLTQAAAELIQQIDAKIPKSCPHDATKLVFNFRYQNQPFSGFDVDQSGGHLPADANKPVFKEHYYFYFEPDLIPEMTIKTLYKMSTIELCANLAGLLGVWLGFSVLDFLRLLSSFRSIVLIVNNWIKSRTDSRKTCLQTGSANQTLQQNNVVHIQPQVYKLVLNQGNVKLTSQNRPIAVSRYTRN